MVISKKTALRMQVCFVCDQGHAQNCQYLGLEIVLVKKL